MNGRIVHSSGNVTLVGGGKARTRDLAEALRHAPCLVAADSGAALAIAQGVTPTAVIGDMDSLDPKIRAVLPPDILHEIPDQDSTDFDKALRSVAAPLVIGVGFLGRRVDHQLANFNVLVRRHGQPCLLIGKRDVVFAAQRDVDLALPAGSRVSLFPLAAVAGRSEGLHWPIDGLDFAPGGTIGTSNHVADGATRVRLCFDAPGMLVILPREALPAALEGLRRARLFAPDG